MPTAARSTFSTGGSMRSSSAALLPLLLAVCAWTSRANAQEEVLGFGVERLYTSAPGAGWFALDSLDMHGGFGGVMGLTLGYAHNPLVIENGSDHLPVVSDQAFANFGFAATYD